MSAIGAKHREAALPSVHQRSPAFTSAPPRSPAFTSAHHLPTYLDEYPTQLLEAEPIRSHAKPSCRRLSVCVRSVHCTRLILTFCYPLVVVAPVIDVVFFSVEEEAPIVSKPAVFLFYFFRVTERNDGVFYPLSDPMDYRGRPDHGGRRVRHSLG